MIQVNIGIPSSFEAEDHTVIEEGNTVMGKCDHRKYEFCSNSCGTKYNKQNCAEFTCLFSFIPAVQHFTHFYVLGCKIPHLFRALLQWILQ